MNCWIITEGIAGTENQCIGIAEALGVYPVIKRINLRQPWRLFSPYLGFEQAWSFTGDSLTPPWPDLVIAAGRKAIAAARYIRKRSGGKTFIAFIQDPRISSRYFDLVAVPAHDSLRGKNVIVTDASPNRITAEKLTTARTQFAHFENIQSPRAAVLIGGNSKAYTLTPAIMENLTQQLTKLDAGLMITTSRRTGTENEKILKEALKDTNAYIWDGHGENPYFGMLAWADYTLVTADSASMLSEACTTGKPVYMIDLEGGSRRIDKLHAHLKNTGCIRPFSGILEHWAYTPLHDAQKVAEEIKKRLKRPL